MKSSIVTITVALLQSNFAASKGIKVGAPTAREIEVQRQREPEQQQERDLYTSETLDLEEAECCTATVPAVVEIEYTYGDDEFAGTNKTLSPTEAAPRPTNFPTEGLTPAPTPCGDQVFFFNEYSECSNEIFIEGIESYATVVACCDFNFGIGSYTDRSCDYIDVCDTSTQPPSPQPSFSHTQVPTVNDDTPEPTPFDDLTPEPTPFDDDGGLTDDYYISTPDPTKRPTRKPSGKPTPGSGYLPTSTYFPTHYDDIDDWSSGWMPTNPSKDDDHTGDVDDWHGGYPVRPTVDSKSGKGSKSGSKSGKGSKPYVTDDAYRGYGVSKVSSLLNYESNSATSSHLNAVYVLATASAVIAYLCV